MLGKLTFRDAVDRIGWYRKERCFVFPRFSINPVGEVRNEAVPIVIDNPPAAHLRDPLHRPFSRDELTALSADGPEVCIFWGLAACVVHNILAPAANREPQGILLDGEGAQVTGPVLARALGCAAIDLRRPTPRQTILERINAACTRHDWPTVLAMPVGRLAQVTADGDDVFGDDPTVDRLQERVADLLGKEAALFVPSGTMANLIAVRTHCRPGDELICEAGSHVYYYEQGGYAQLCGVAIRPVEGQDGILGLEQLENLPRPADVHFPRTRLVCLEHTHNRGGGRIQPYPVVESICGWAHAQGLKTHLDGARLLHAVVATGIEATRWASHFDTVGICFSKGLGAPVGSALAGPRELIDEARRHRKVLGGGMRQAGVLAAAALYALDHHVARLAEDHAHARRLADGIRGIEGLRVAPEMVDTNIVIFHVDPRLGTAPQLVERLRERGLLVLPRDVAHIRMVTHLDIAAEDVERAIEVLREAVGRTA